MIKTNTKLKYIHKQREKQSRENRKYNYLCLFDPGEFTV